MPGPVKQPCGVTKSAQAPAGAGKSFFCKLLSLRQLVNGTGCIVVDPEDEYRPLAAAVGGHALVVARETLQLTYLAAIQHLPPRQRAVLILRDALDFSAQEVAAQLDTTLAAVNHALNRARATMRARLGTVTQEPAPTSSPTADELAVLQRYMHCHDTLDLDGLATLLRADARLVMPPISSWFQGRDAILAMQAAGFNRETFGVLRGVATAANLQPAVAWYLRRPQAEIFEALAIDVLRVERGEVVEITTFVEPKLFAAFGLPATQ
jgi:RNA polymerase sigma-70 factor (ECF subfamily)